ncbi:MAG: AAA family ATPase [Saprospiraceae bacterium]|nr:AAA family ATPase [Saprospiraceae bacterium]
MWRLTTNLQWGSLRESFGWIRDMEGVEQDPIYHAEGDVAIHTQMVLASLQSLPAFQALGEQTQQVMIAAALLHDVEKRSTSVRNEKGRISSPKHAKKGEYTGRSILFQDVPTPFDLREQVAKLVRYHGLPLLVFDKPNPQRYLLKASLEVDTQLLAMLCKADVLGRTCEDQDELLYRIECFEAYAKEQQCWGQAYPFASDLARFTYFQGEEGYPAYKPFDDTWPEVVLMVGLPGMGKDTYIRTHLKDLPVVSLDNLRRKHKVGYRNAKGNGRIIQLALEEAREHLRDRRSFVWNATNLTRNNRSRLIDLFTTYKASVRIVYIEVPYQLWQAQNVQRTYAVPKTVLAKMLKKLEVPSLVEAHRVEYRVS